MLSSLSFLTLWFIPDTLKIDVNYYLAHQIHPVVSRLVAPIEGTSPARIAECLGLDPSGYRRQGPGGRDDVDEEVSSIIGWQLKSFFTFLLMHQF